MLLVHPTHRHPVPAPLAGPAGSAIGFAGGTAVTLVAALLGARDAPVLGLVMLAAAAVATATVTTVAGALAAAAQCWGLWDGFLVNGLGELRLDGLGGGGLTALVLCAAVVSAAAAAGRRVRARRTDRSPLWTSTTSIRLPAPPPGSRAYQGPSGFRQDRRPTARQAAR